MTEVELFFFSRGVDARRRILAGAGSKAGVDRWTRDTMARNVDQGRAWIAGFIHPVRVDEVLPDGEPSTWAPDHAGVARDRIVKLMVKWWTTETRARLEDQAREAALVAIEKVYAAAGFDIHDASTRAVARRVLRPLVGAAGPQ